MHFNQVRNFMPRKEAYLPILFLRLTDKGFKIKVMGNRYGDNHDLFEWASGAVPRRLTSRTSFERAASPLFLNCEAAYLCVF